jgi:putative restriction endonuclease
MNDLETERQRRLQLWHQIAQEQDLNSVEPQRLRALGIYGGAQGIWVDKLHTANSETTPDGVTVGVLHTGRHYEDDLSEDGVIYHYPKTSRPPARDAGEVQATKNAMSYQLPVFIVLPGKVSTARRSLKLGWVSDFDDELGQFLVLFGDNVPKYTPAKAPDEPFQLMSMPTKNATTVLARRGQQRFRFQVMSQYGSKCAVCDIRYPALLKAAHICGVAQQGSDDWRNGIPLCATHHDAFDDHLFCIHPNSKLIECKPGIIAVEIGLRETSLKTLKSGPHQDALKWRWDITYKQWRLAHQE